jgi:hypothetical protein
MTTEAEENPHLAAAATDASRARRRAAASTNGADVDPVVSKAVATAAGGPSWSPPWASLLRSAPS